MKKYIIFQLDGKIDDLKEGREAWWQITRNASKEHIDQAFKDGFYHFTWEMEAQNPEVVFMVLNHDSRPTGQFCPSLSCGDLVYEIDGDKYRWLVVASVGYDPIDLPAMKWYIKEVKDNAFILEHRICGYKLEVPKIWLERHIQLSLTNKYHRCTKCRIIKQMGQEVWDSFQKEEDPIDDAPIPDRDPYEHDQADLFGITESPIPDEPPINDPWYEDDVNLEEIEAEQERMEALAEEELTRSLEDEAIKRELKELEKYQDYQEEEHYIPDGDDFDDEYLYDDDYDEEAESENNRGYMESQDHYEDDEPSDEDYYKYEETKREMEFDRRYSGVSEPF